MRLAVVSQFALRAGWPVFSEAIVTAPAPVLDSLAGLALPAACRTINGQGGSSGSVTASRAARIGQASRSYEVTGTDGWTWAEVVRGPSFVLEVRIPQQAPWPGGDPAQVLEDITSVAYQRAVSLLAS